MLCHPHAGGYLQYVNTGLSRLEIRFLNNIDRITRFSNEYGPLLGLRRVRVMMYLVIGPLTPLSPSTPASQSEVRKCLGALSQSFQQSTTSLTLTLPTCNAK